MSGMSKGEMDIKYVARLARLELTPAEEAQWGAQLDQILHYFAVLKRLDVSEVEPTAHALPRANVTRPDQIEPGLSQEDALRNAPAAAEGLFLVPKIVE
jgi:aspartyl-tRNA(Asn)/glutamyl-tRNA(Gln) amidotransferase subunit C